MNLPLLFKLNLSYCTFKLQYIWICFLFFLQWLISQSISSLRSDVLVLASKMRFICWLHAGSHELFFVIGSKTIAIGLNEYAIWGCRLVVFAWNLDQRWVIHFALWRSRACSWEGWVCTLYRHSSHLFHMRCHGDADILDVSLLGKWSILSGFNFLLYLD